MATGYRGTGATAPTSLAVDFANPDHCPACRAPDALGALADARRWIQARAEMGSVRIGGRDLTPLRRLREEVRELLHAATGRAPPSRAVIDSLNRHAARGGMRTELKWEPGRYTKVEVLAPQSAGERISAWVARDTIDLLSGSRAKLLRRCHGAGCLHYLVARNTLQLWCSPTGCGNRARVQRHYRKSHARTARPGLRMPAGRYGHKADNRR